MHRKENIHRTQEVPECDKTHYVYPTLFLSTYNHMDHWETFSGMVNSLKEMNWSTWKKQRLAEMPRSGEKLSCLEEAQASWSGKDMLQPVDGPVGY